MKILCITHADFESPGIIEDWAKDKGYQFQIKKPYKGDVLDQDFDLLIVMGGPQSAIKLDDFPYLKEEISIIKSAIENHKKVLGFCLGAQLIGVAMGAAAQRNAEKEVGVYPLHLTKEGRQDPLLSDLKNPFPVIHWHNDMPGLSSDAVVLAYSEGCPRQIIRYTPIVYGFQCHLEIDLNGMITMIEAVPEDLAPSKFTQSHEILLQQDYTSINKMMLQLLNRFVTI